MKYSVLQLTQNILSALNSDQVNSISDTVESLQVANIIQTTYFNMLSKYDLPENNQLFQLTASTDPTKPVLMTKPAGIQRLEWVKYFDSNPQDGATLQTGQFGAFAHDLNTNLNTSGTVGWLTSSTTSNTIGIGNKTFTVGAGLLINANDSAIAISGANSMLGTVVSYSGTTLVLNITSTIGTGTYAVWTIEQNIVGGFGPGYLDVCVEGLEQFLYETNRFNPSDPTVKSFTLTITNEATGELDNFTFYYKNNLQPRHCTVLSNQYVIFDSFDQSQDSTLQQAKTMCYGWVQPAFSLTDSFVPALDDNMFPLLLNEAKSLAFLELKQMTHQKAEQEVQRQLSSLQKFKAVSKKPGYFDQLADFGRRRNYW